MDESLVNRDDDPARMRGDAPTRTRFAPPPATEFVKGKPSSVIHELLDAAIRELGDRKIEILRRRVFADYPETLDDLAKAFGGLSRERVRQLEVLAKASLSASMEVGPLGALADEMRGYAYDLASLDRLVRESPSILSEVESVDQPVWRIYERLDDSYEIHDGWFARPSVAAQVESTQVLLRATKASSVALRAAEAALNNRNLKDRLLPWLEYCGFTILEEQVILGGSAIGDRAEAILRGAGEPLDSETLLSRLGADRSLRSMKNVLSVDDRFDRVNRSAWGLREWGLETYESIRDLIGREVDRGGGSIALDEVIDHLTAQFSVSAKSVLAYASAPPFKNTRGVISLSSGHSNRMRPANLTARMFRRPDEWILRTVVTEDHLRGSGSILPRGLISALGIDFGQSRLLPSRRGDQAVAWTSLQPSLGSIRRFVLEDPIPLGTTIFICFRDAGSFEIEVLEESPDLVSSILAMAGLRRDPAASAIGQLAFAIGSSPEDGVSDVVAALRRKGDHDIAELLQGL